jgi:lipopolysaccharide/colanic/teichoic acid biosynthesis glycosyltransferase
MKRVLDVLLSAVALLLLSPLLLGLAAAVRFALGSPILFRQSRPGLHGHPFSLYKFRSLLDDPTGTRSDQERLTRFGALLRRTSLDELPELWNVLRGDMSLVGPRPLLLEYLPLYTAEQARRHDVRPGLTGWAQVNGRNAISWEEKFRLDLWYVEHRSLWLDLRILALTLRRVIAGEGISEPGQATATPFRGSGPG